MTTRETNPQSCDKLQSDSPARPSAAERALAEAAERRAQAAAVAQPGPKEFNGRNGPDPTRFGDWESRGIASDF